MNTTVHIVLCPTCKKPVSWTDKNQWRPFCCKRCSDIDLGAWANEHYKVPTNATQLVDDFDEQE